jgi:hypothetical protein
MDTMKKEPPVDTTVLGRYYASATDEEILAGIKSLQFELDVRENRREVGRLGRERDKARANEVAVAIADIEAQYRPYDVERDGL